MDDLPSSLKSPQGESFERYYEPYIKPDPSFFADYAKRLKKAKTTSRLRLFLTLIAAISILYIYHDSIFKIFSLNYSQILELIFALFLVLIATLIFIKSPENNVQCKSENNLISKLLGFFDKSLTFAVDPKKYDHITKTLTLFDIIEDPIPAYIIEGNFKERKMALAYVCLTYNTSGRKTSYWNLILIIEAKQQLTSNLITISNDDVEKKSSDEEINNSLDKNSFLKNDILQYLTNLSKNLNADDSWCKIIGNKLLIAVEIGDDEFFFVPSNEKESVFYQNYKEFAKRLYGFLSITEILDKAN